MKMHSHLHPRQFGATRPIAAETPPTRGGQRRSVIAVMVMTLALLATSMAAAPAAVAAPSDPVVRVAEGLLRGAAADHGAEAFLGVPYAQPPVGDLRLAAPQPVERWRGLRQATEHSAACLQARMGTVHGGQTTDEDCLYLDVYRPAKADKHDRLPVLVWIHGGGFGSGSGGLFNGSEMAAQTGSIVVSINYRVGVLGYLAVEQMGEDAGNLGLLDQIAALRWVNGNIAAFGGDASRLTVAGQSAGAMSICGLLVSPLGAGLFTRAALQSGPCEFPAFSPRDRALEQGARILATVGCDAAADSLDCLRQADAGALMTSTFFITPSYGGAVLPQDPADAIEQGDWHQVPVLLGSTRWEGKQGLFFSVGPSAPSMTAEEYEARVRASYGDNADAVLEHYPASAYDLPAYALAAIDTDSGFGCRTYSTAEKLASQVPTYEYEFEDPTSPTQTGLRLEGLDMSSAHSAELAYLFEYADTERPLTPTETVLASRMKSYWADFTRTGEPGGSWAPVTDDAHPVLRLQPGDDVAFDTFSQEHQCEFWTGLRG